MKKLSVLLIVIAIVAGACLAAGCGGKKTEKARSTTPKAQVDAKYVGKYVSQANPANYVELRANHTFTWMNDGSETAGSYAIEGTKVMMSAGSFTDEMTVGNNTITDSKGTVYTKQ